MAPRRSILKFALAVLLFVAALTLQIVGYASAGFMAAYTVFSKTVSAALALVFSVFPFSAAEVLLYAAVLGLLTWIVYFIFQLIRRKGLRWAVVLRFISSLLLIISSLYFIFIVFWGLNYSAPPLSEKLGLPVKERALQELYNTTYRILELTNKTAEAAPRDAEGLCTFGATSDMLNTAASSYLSLFKKYPQYEAPFCVSPKPVLNWYALSSFGISGIYSPFTGESNVNTDTPPFMLPFTAAHELSHRLGVAREDEANFSAFLCCIQSTDARFQYSGYLGAYIYAINSLYAYSPDAAKTLAQHQSPLVTNDLRIQSEHVRKYEGPVEKFGERVNDVYLKSMKQQDGVLSYGRMVDLLLAYYEGAV